MNFKYNETLELSIIMPCLNEEAALPVCIDRARRFMSERGINGEIIVVDNASTDDSAAVARRAGARVIKEPRRGYGRALRTGISHSRGSVIILGDCDTTYDFYRLEGLYAPLKARQSHPGNPNDTPEVSDPAYENVPARSRRTVTSLTSFKKLPNESCGHEDCRSCSPTAGAGFDIMMGDRLRGSMAHGAMPVTHILGVKFLSALARLRFGVGVHDFHCGLRGMTHEAALKMDLKTTGMEFATEFIAEAAKKGLSIGETPVVLHRASVVRRSKLRPIADGLRHLAFILFYRIT